MLRLVPVGQRIETVAAAGRRVETVAVAARQALLLMAGPDLREAIQAAIVATLLNRRLKT